MWSGSPKRCLRRYSLMLGLIPLLLREVGIPPRAELDTAVLRDIQHGGLRQARPLCHQPSRQPRLVQRHYLLTMPLREALAYGYG